MNNIGFALEGAWKVLAAGILLGAGLPALFALGVRLLAAGTGGTAVVGGDGQRSGHVAAKLAAWLCFALVLGAVALGISIIVASGFGMKVSFENVIPVFVEK